MGIFDIFTGGGNNQQQSQPQGQQPNQQQQQPQGQQPVQQVQQQPPANQHVLNNQTIPNGTNSAPPQIGPDGKPVSSPTDKFANLWQNDPNPQANPLTAPLININQQQLGEQVKRMDFAKQIPQDLFQAALGDDKAAAAQALAQIINSVGQTAVAQGLIGNSMITENAVKEYGKNLRGEIPNLIKSATVQDGMKQLNPALYDPAHAPLVGAIQQQMQLKYPQANATELQKMVSDYLDGFAQAAGAPKAEQQRQQQQQNNKETDWEQFLTNGSPFGPN